MDIIVCVKYVPDATDGRGFTADNTIDRAGTDGLLSELDEYAVEQALQIREWLGDGSEVTVVSVGPERAVDAIHKALQMDADKGVHVVDGAIAGADAVATSRVLAEAIKRLPHDLVLCGMASTDGGMGVIPAMLSERLDVPGATLGSQVGIAHGKLTIRRDGEAATEVIEASLPCVLSVTDQSGDPHLTQAPERTDMNEVMTLADHDCGVVSKTTTELLTIARRLGEPSAVFIGSPDDDAVATLKRHGAEKIYADITGYLVTPKAEVLAELVRQASPAAVLVTSSGEGNEIAGRLAITTGSGIITDAVDVRPGPVATQSMLAGDHTVQATVTKGTPIIAVKPNAAPPEPAEGAGAVHHVVITIPDVAKGARITRMPSRSARPARSCVPAALHRQRHLRRDPAPRGHADLQDHRRGQHRPRGTDLRTRGLRRRGRPAHRSPRSHRGDHAQVLLTRCADCAMPG